MSAPPPLQGYRVVSLALNVPGPVAAARLHQFGAEVTKVEPPSGDPLEHACPGWYNALTHDQIVVRLNLKDPSDRALLDPLLKQADLLVTSQRPSALGRLGLDWPPVHARFPELCHIAIVSDSGPEADVSGHDLTYLAVHGLLQPPALPRTLAADLLGAERAVSAALTLALAHWRGAGAARIEVPLAEAAATLAEPLRSGLTAPGGPLGGGLPGYGLYDTARGWIAVAALEPHFWRKLLAELHLDPDTATHERLAAIFRTRTAAGWAAWAAEHDLPLAAVHEHAR